MVKPTGSLRLNTTDAGIGKTSSNRTVSEKFQGFLSGAVDMTQRTLNSVTPFIPGGAVVSAAVNSFASTAQAGISSQFAGTGPFGGIGGGSYLNLPSLQGMGGGGIGGLGSGLPNAGGLPPEMQQMLSLQRQVNLESQTFSTISNIMKSRHDATMTAISNMR